MDHAVPPAETKFIAGELLEPREWRSSGQMWVMEIIAPYGQSSAVKTVRYMPKDADHKAHEAL